MAIDRELDVPRSWTEDAGRCRAAGIPDTVAFATKPALAARMIGRALDAGVAGDEVYGGNPHLRTDLERCGIGYVLAVACDHRLPTRGGKFGARALVKKLPKRAWQRLSAGAGAKEQRFYDWALADIAGEGPGHHQLLVRRNRRTRLAGLLPLLLSHPGSALHPKSCPVDHVLIQSRAVTRTIAAL
jgi:hypothetical protein